MDDEKKIRHLEMIQSIIQRMSNNSFMLKGWSITLISGIFILAEKDTNQLFFVLAYVPTIFFWFLDAYYLKQERMYRNLYDHVRKLPINKIDFSLNAKTIPVSDTTVSIWSCLWSKTEWTFYIPLTIVCALVTYFSLM